MQWLRRAYLLGDGPGCQLPPAQKSPEAFASVRHANAFTEAHSTSYHRAYRLNSLGKRQHNERIPLQPDLLACKESTGSTVKVLGTTNERRVKRMQRAQPGTACL